MEYKSNAIKTLTILITPDIANDMLAHNIDHNRKIKPNWVRALAESMKRGTFELSPHGIAFDKDGKLIDGQHRLSAVIMSGCSVKMRVTFGCDKSNMGIIDTGARRVTHDYMTMISDEKCLTSTSIVGAFSAMLKKRNSPLLRSLSPSEMAEMLVLNIDIARIIYECTVSKRMTNANSAMRGALTESLIITGDADAILEFRNAYEFNEIPKYGNYCYSAAIALRQRILDCKIKHTSITAASMYNLTQNAFYLFNNSTKERIALRNTQEDRYICEIQKLLNGEYNKQFAR